MKSTQPSLFESATYDHIHRKEPVIRPSTFHLKDLAQYAIAAFIFVVYGIQVCPFLEALERPFFVSVVLTLFVMMFAVRCLLFKSMPQEYIAETIKKQFAIDMAIFITGGLLLAIGNQLIYEFPVGASLRVLIGFVILGFFISVQLNLQKEYQMTAALKPYGPSSKASSTTSVTAKIRWLTLFLLAGSILTLLLIIFKDFEWLKNVGDEVSLNQATLWILYEILFVMVVFGVYGCLMLNCLFKNINNYFSYQNSTLSAVREGDRDLAVPVVSNDEFAVMAEHTNHMIKSLCESEALLKQTRDTTILAISSLAETRDNETGAHILRTQEYVKALCLYLQKDSRFVDELTDEKLELIYKSSPLHDIGKVGIPDAILLKPGKLTDDEFEVMKTHALIGKQAIEKAEEQMGEMPFLRYAKEISESHHEKWDGSGYPYGLKGQEIPLSGRLMALADVYDALISQRVYKPAFSHEKAKGIILEGRGKHFDPDVLDAFVAIEHEFIAIAKRLKDG